MSLVKFVSGCAESFLLGVMAILTPFSPIACVVLSGRLRFLHDYRRTVSKSSQYVKALKRTGVISRNIQRKLSASTEAKEIIEGSCTHCGLCCVDRSCVFLEVNDANISKCMVYNNWFWKLTSCGSYPIDSQSIEVYGCPTYKAIPIKLVKSKNE
jgi:hypothetical protein